MASKSVKQVSLPKSLNDENKRSHHKVSVLTNLRNCDDQIVSLEALIENNLKEEASVVQKKKRLEESKGKLCEQQPRLQERLHTVIQAITQSESECFSLRKKLPYLSRRAIVDNIGHLELQLRLHNYRPREEELMLKEISKLRNSLPVLEEYRTSVQLNRQHRSDRVRLVSQRNDCYDRLQALLPKIQACSDQLACVQHTLQENRRGLAEVNQHKAHLLEVAKKQLEKKRRRQLEHEQLRNEGQTPLVSLSGASEVPLTPRRVVPVERDVYAPQLAACRRLLQYCRSVGPVPCDDVTPTLLSTTGPADATKWGPERDLEGDRPVGRVGTFYSKPKDGLEPNWALPHQRSLHKKRKARNLAKKDLRHPPDVIGHFLDLGVEVPKCAGDIPAIVIDIQQKLNYFEMLNEQVYFDTVKAIRMEDETADIIHVVFQENKLSDKTRASNGPCSTRSRKTESLDARTSDSGFVCHRTHNIFESEASVEVIVGTSPPKLYSDIAKTPLTPIVEKSLTSTPPSEIPGGENLAPASPLSASQSTASIAAAQVRYEGPLPGEATRSSDGEVSTAEEKETFRPLIKDDVSASLEPVTQFCVDLHDENPTHVSSIVDVESISPTQGSHVVKESSYLEADLLSTGLDSHQCLAAERTSCDDEDCESGVYEADCAQKMDGLQVTDNSSLLPTAHGESPLIPSLSPPATKSSTRNSENGRRGQPHIIVECVTEGSAEAGIVMDPSCSSDSSSSSGCSCAGSSSASSTQGVGSRDQQETQSFPDGNPATLPRNPSSVAYCDQSCTESVFTEGIEASSKINADDSIPCSSSRLLPLPTVTKSTSNITDCTGSSLNVQGGTVHSTGNSNRNKSTDKENDNKDVLAVRSGFCALSPCQAAALAVSETATVVSYAAIAKKKS